VASRMPRPECCSTDRVLVSNVRQRPVFDRDTVRCVRRAAVMSGGRRGSGAWARSHANSGRRREMVCRRAPDVLPSNGMEPGVVLGETAVGAVARQTAKQERQRTRWQKSIHPALKRSASACAKRKRRRGSKMPSRYQRCTSRIPAVAYRKPGSVRDRRQFYSGGGRESGSGQVRPGRG